MVVEIGICLLSIGFSIFLFIFALKLPPGAQKGIPGPALFPFMISIIIFMLSLGIAVNAFLRNYKKKDTDIINKNIIESKFLLPLFLTISLLGIYSVLWIIDIGNFIMNSIIIFVPLGLLFSKKRWYFTTLFIIVLVIIIYLIFSKILRVPLLL